MFQVVRYVNLLIAVFILRPHAITVDKSRTTHSFLLELLHGREEPEILHGREEPEILHESNIILPKFSGGNNFLLRLLHSSGSPEEDETFTFELKVKKPKNQTQSEGRVSQAPEIPQVQIPEGQKEPRNGTESEGEESQAPEIPQNFQLPDGRKNPRNHTESEGGLSQIPEIPQNVSQKLEEQKDPRNHTEPVGGISQVPEIQQNVSQKLEEQKDQSINIPKPTRMLEETTREHKLEVEKTLGETKKVEKTIGETRKVEKTIGETKKARNRENQTKGHRKRAAGISCLTAKNNEFCLEGKTKYITPYLNVLQNADIGASYADSKIISSPCADIGFTKFGKKDGCYKKRLTLWFHPEEEGEAELHDNHFAQADQKASADWVASHSTDEWEDMMQTFNPCNNSYSWDPS